jgi:hypothetical protein
MVGSSPKQPWLIQLGSSIVGAAVGVYTGANFLIPGVAGAAIWYIGNKTIRPAQPQYMPAITAQGAHLVWLLVGMAITRTWGINLLDVFILTIGLTWLWLRPGVWPVMLLTVFQLLALAVNVALILDMPLGSIGHKALVLHILLRVIALGAMWYALVRNRHKPHST